MGHGVNLEAWRSCGVGVLVAVVFSIAVLPPVLGVGLAAASQPAIEEFVPINELPDGDRLPAAPFLISAYSIVWILAFGYFWLLSRRLSEVERELSDLTRRSGVGGEADSGG